MSKRTIKCQDCGTDYETGAKNTKRCRVCQLIQQFEYLGGRTRECVVPLGGAHRFAPIDSKDKLCGHHDISPRAQDVEGTCGICREATSQLVHDTVHICRPCIKDPDNRDEVLKNLYWKRAVQVDEREQRGAEV